MNKVILSGRLTRDAEVKYGKSGKGEDMAIARFTIAVDRQARDAGADFISCVAFGKAGEFYERFGHKGTKFVIEGRIQTGSYTDKDGNKHYTTDVVVERSEFAESKGSGSASNISPDSDQRERSTPEPQNEGFMNIPEDIEEGLPFN